MRLLPALFGVVLVIAPAFAVGPAKLPSNPEFPDPLVMMDGTKVETKAAWLEKRRPELKNLFETYMYGRYPMPAAAVEGKVVYEDKAALGGKATLREVALQLIGKEGMPAVYVLIVTPNMTKGKVPTFVGLNFTGNHTFTADPKVHLPEGWMYDRPGVVNNKATDDGRGKNMDVFPLEAIIDRGYAVVTAYSGDIIPDNPKVRGGYVDALMPLSKGDPDPSQTATVMAWAWGLHRITDYLTKLPEIDAKRIAVVGHSRLGKAAMVATAFDDRIALGIPLQAGCGGTAPNRSKNPKGEPVKRINTSFPHWFCGHFKAFNDDQTKLPFDQHSLVAICAPRPVLFANATEDQWADPPGQFEVLKAATPVYKLFGVEGLTADKFPEENKLINSRLGYWVRPGKHAMTPDDWKIFMDFADVWMK